MKFIIFLAGLALAGYAGYQVEPSLRITLTGNATSHPDSTPQDKPVPTPEIDFSTITPEQLPAEVTLLSDVGFSDDSTGLRMTLQAGAAAKLVRVVDDIVIIRIGTTEYITSVPISQTDLVQRLLNPTSAEQPAEQPQPPAETPATPTPEAPPAPTPAPGPDPSFPESEPAPTPAPTPTPAPEPTPTPEPTPQPAPTPEPTPTSQPATDVNVVAIMRQSLEKGEIKEFTVAQVKSWKAEPQETVDGGTFDAGSVTYEQETIFGLKTIIAKAYIRNGKVERWIWPKSGLTIQ